MTEQEMVEKCWPSPTAKFDSCPFLWYNYSRLNYATAHVEDSPGVASFNFHKTGKTQNIYASICQINILILQFI